MKNAKMHPLRFVLQFYIICFFFRAAEYLLLRTDQSVIGEAFIHKIIGIFLLAAAIRILQYRWSDIGICADKAVRAILLGLLFGISVFTVAYGIEAILQASAGNAPTLRFYVTSYAIQGNRGMQDGAIFILICIIGNIINVFMEEGIFRGLFVRLIKEKYSFAMSCFFSSILFGIWHIAQPVRNVLDGQQTLEGAIMAAVLLVTTSTLLGVQYAMLFELTGSLWIGMAAHFVNNAIINLLHVATSTGFDELQTVRIAIAQTLSFAIVLVIFLRKYKKMQPQ